jgi:hypothetical protein
MYVAWHNSKAALLSSYQPSSNHRHVPLVQILSAFDLIGSRMHVGVDPGGTKIEVAAVDPGGRYAARVRTATPEIYGMRRSPVALLQRRARLSTHLSIR